MEMRKSINLSDVLAYAGTNFSTMFSKISSDTPDRPNSRCFVHKDGYVFSNTLSDLYYGSSEGYLYLFLYCLYKILNKNTDSAVQLGEVNISIVPDISNAKTELFSVEILKMICDSLPTFGITITADLNEDSQIPLAENNSNFRRVWFCNTDEFVNSENSLTNYTDIYVYDVVESSTYSVFFNKAVPLIKAKTNVAFWNRSIYNKCSDDILLLDYVKANSFIVTGSYKITRTEKYKGQEVYKYFCKLNPLAVPKDCFEAFFLDMLFHLNSPSSDNAAIPTSLTLTMTDLDVNTGEKLAGAVPYAYSVTSDQLLQLLSLIYAVTGKPINFVGFTEDDEYNYLEYVAELMNGSSASLFEKISWFRNIEPNKLYFVLEDKQIHPFLLKRASANLRLSLYKLSDICDLIQPDKKHNGYYKFLADALASLTTYAVYQDITALDDCSVLPLHALLQILVDKVYQDYQQMLQWTVYERVSNKKTFGTTDKKSLFMDIDRVKPYTKTKMYSEEECMWRKKDNLPFSKVFFEYLYVFLRTVEAACTNDLAIISLADICLVKHHDVYYLGVGTLKPSYTGNKLFVTGSVALAGETTSNNLVPASVLHDADLSSALFKHMANVCGVPANEDPKKCMGKPLMLSHEHALLWLCSCCNYDFEFNKEQCIALFKSVMNFDNSESRIKNEVILEVLCNFFSIHNRITRKKDWVHLVNSFSSYGLRALTSELSPLTIYGGLNVSHNGSRYYINTYPITFSEVRL